jgi:hypothetical protein
VHLIGVLEPITAPTRVFVPDQTVEALIALS